MGNVGVKQRGRTAGDSSWPYLAGSGGSQVGTQHKYQAPRGVLYLSGHLLEAGRGGNRPQACLQTQHATPVLFS